MASKAKIAQFIGDFEVRRSVYALSKKDFPLPQKEVTEIVQQIVKWTPSAFNFQPVRAIVLFNEHHDKLWNDITYNALKEAVPAEAFVATEQKIKAFAAAYGTVIFFESVTDIEDLQAKFPTYAKAFPEWAGHTTGAVTINTWTALALGKVGANLQHYHPLINEGVYKTWNVPKDWRITGQLVFGTEVAPPGEKTFKTGTVKAFT